MSEANWQYTLQVLGVAAMLAGMVLLWFLRRKLTPSMGRAKAGLVAMGVTFVSIVVAWWVLDGVLGALRSVFGTY